MFTMIVLLIVLLLLNFWFLYLYIKYRTKVEKAGFLTPWPIAPVSVATISAAFEVSSHSGPTHGAGSEIHRAW